MTPFDYPPWLVMWGLAAALFAACKGFTLRGIRAPLRRKLAYSVAWPGLDVRGFCTAPSPPKPGAGEWLFAAAKTAFGVGVVFGVTPHLDPPLLRGWVGMVGILFVLHFGLFHLLSCGWRRAGVVAKPLMNWPILATSLADFWARRWNTAFRDLTHRFLFRPLTPWLGAKAALGVGFFVSGLVHELVISLPANAGYGWPTLYFTLQGVGLLVERAVPRLRGRPFTALVVVGPAFGLFHPPFVERVVVPFLDWLTNPALAHGSSNPLWGFHTARG